MRTDIGALIARLDDPSTDIAENAKYALINQGAGVVLQLAASLAGLGRYGKLSATEVFEACDDRRADPALIGLLGDGDTTVREWAARALRALRATEAGPALTQLYARLVRERVSPGETEPVAVREAMTSLGLRPRVTPGLARELAHNIGGKQRWPAARLAEIVAELAAHDQVVLYFMIWRVAGDGRLYGREHERVGWTFDYARSWPENVAAARDAALLEATFVTDTADLVASIEWIDQSDVTVAPSAAG